VIYLRALLVLQILLAPNLVGQQLPSAQEAEIPLTNLGSTLRDLVTESWRGFDLVLFLKISGRA